MKRETLEFVELALENLGKPRRRGLCWEKVDFEQIS